MSYLSHIRNLNQYDLSHFIPWFIGDQQVGWMKHDFVAQLRNCESPFEIDAQGAHLDSTLSDFDSRTEALAALSRSLVEEGVIANWHGEPYPVATGNRDQALCQLDRASAAYFGIRAFGQHLSGYVRKEGELFVWVAKRAMDRINFPGQLDHLVAGGLPWGISLQDNLVKECYEEAGIEAELARSARPVSCISYCVETEAGLKPDVLYCYDLELSEDFVPHCTDGEVESFSLMPVAEVAKIVDETEDYKANCNLVVTDFLLRHGVLGPEHPDYLAIATGLHTRL